MKPDFLKAILKEVKNQPALQEPNIYQQSTDIALQSSLQK